MKGYLSREFINSFALTKNDELFDIIQNKVFSVLSAAVQSLTLKIPFITPENTILQPVNETFNTAITPISEYIYFLGIQSPQIEINCQNKNNLFKNFSKKLNDAWQSTKKKKNNNKEVIKEEKSMAFNPEEYDFERFCIDLQRALIENLVETTVVYRTDKKIIIQGKDDFGFLSKIIIIPVIYRDGIHKYFLNKKKGFIEINMDERLKNFQKKHQEIGEKFVTMIKIFNNIFINITKEKINQIFIESLLFNIPNELYEDDDIYEVFIRVINYLNIIDISNFKSIENLDQNLYNNKLTQNSIYTFNKLLKKIS